ncbi:MAG: hypothetical protein GKR89_14600 [Candidatus Latescibacteria bacterium]|nr:hypothetical protein [Candidatus Latescibacterota bacterium]
MLTGVGHIVMAVTNLSACRAHYGQGLGLAQLGAEDGANSQQYLFGIGPSIIELRQKSTGDLNSAATRPVVDHLAFYVDDLERAYTALKERDVDFLSAPAATAPGHRNMQRALATLVDPDGFAVQLSQTIDPRPHLQTRQDAKHAMASASTLSPPFGGIDHISTYCTDFARTRDFYRRQLGLEEFFHSTTREQGQAVVPGFAQSAFAVGGTDIELAVYDTQAPVAPGIIRQLGFISDDIDRTFGELRDNGVALDGPPTEQSPLPGVRHSAFTLQAPDGLQIKIAQVL